MKTNFGMIAAMAMLQPPKESQASRLARMTGMSEEEVKVSMANMGMNEHGEYPRENPPKHKADPEKKRRKKAEKVARRKNR